MILQRVLAAVWRDKRLQRADKVAESGMYPYCLVVQRREVADGAHLKVESEELLISSLVLPFCARTHLSFQVQLLDPDSPAWT